MVWKVMPVLVERQFSCTILSVFTTSQLTRSLKESWTGVIDCEVLETVADFRTHQLARASTMAEWLCDLRLDNWLQYRLRLLDVAAVVFPQLVPIYNPLSLDRDGPLSAGFRHWKQSPPGKWENRLNLPKARPVDLPSSKRGGANACLLPIKFSQTRRRVDNFHSQAPAYDYSG